MSRPIFHLMFMLMIEGVWMTMVICEVYNIGDSDGWTTLVDSNYSTWASLKEFRVGDILLFNYNPTNHNVMQVNHVSFESCNITMSMKTYESGNDSFTITAPGHYYFICSFPGHCDAGQKVDIRVLKKHPLAISPHTNFSTLTSPKAIAMAPAPVANVATDSRCLLGTTVVTLVSCAMLVA
ncbi:mavicyanin-like [Cynara cardunculus var. scolymus]|uniref:mavicyanin-like n=1 Tax=Cynara cardunculus var. scolymus TaxID=59895 RepID=UPI000D62791B|nr:mavicyanin-like [Cynara cardunculus var. scolymus]